MSQEPKPDAELKLAPAAGKVVRSGTHRTRGLEETLSAALRLAPAMGITRVANVTGLDEIGIPVVMVARPNSRSVAVSQGKGIDLMSARVSGLMEAAELYHAETMTQPLRLASYTDLCFQHAIVDVAKLPRGKTSRFDTDLRLLWCEGEDLTTSEKLLVPFEMVHTDYTWPLPDGHGCFTASSNGLASGNSVAEAISQAICEVVERDATTLWQLRSNADLNHCRIGLNTIDDEVCKTQISKYTRAGFLVAIWDMTSDIGLAAFACMIAPEDHRQHWYSSPSAGYGCHPAREIALSRALTEAAQVRLTFISGVRDDLRRWIYDQLSAETLHSKIRDCMATPTSMRSFTTVPTYNNDTLEEDVADEVRCLRHVGLDQVIVVDLTKPGFEIPVMRVIIPGAEPMPESDYQPGYRAQAFLASMQ